MFENIALHFHNEMNNSWTSNNWAWELFTCTKHYHWQPPSTPRF